MSLNKSEIELLDAAQVARDRAYAPYSSFAVGAALKCANGEIVTGCNVENISFGLTMCAERVAVGGAIQKGIKEFKVLAIVTDSKSPVVPCGACRQVLAEFAPYLRIVTRTIDGETAEFDLAVLLPVARQGILG